MLYFLLESGSSLLLESDSNLLIEGISFPYEFSSVLIGAGNANPFGVDPEQTTPIIVANVNPFSIDPEQTTLITSGLTSAD